MPTYLPKSTNIACDPARNPAIYWQYALLSACTIVKTEVTAVQIRLSSGPDPDRLPGASTYQNAAVVSISGSYRNNL